MIDLGCQGTWLTKRATIRNSIAQSDGAAAGCVSAYFTNKFTVVRPVHRVSVDLTHGMLRELDERAARLNVSRQAVIKTLLRQALNERSGSWPESKKKAG